MKKLLAVLLMVSMLALMLPISALALVDYEISVADVAVTGQNAADVLGDGTVSYDPEQNVLTLKNANIVGDIDIEQEEITLKLVGANKLQAPGDAIECIAMDVVGDGSLEILAGSDGFDYDYHLMWDHLRDPGYVTSTKILFDDMQNLDKIGLNGMISCQLTRSAFRRSIIAS